MQLFGTTIPDQVVSLHRYARIVGYTEWAFFGISHPDNQLYQLRKIWRKDQREDIQGYLAQAQSMIEDVVEFPLKPRWIADERHDYSLDILSRWCKVIESGVMASEDISLGAIVDLTSEPAVVTVIPVSSDLSPDEVRVFYPSTDEEIFPSSVVVEPAPVSFGVGVYQLVVRIPRARIVEYSKLQNPEEGWVWNDDSNFQTSVDIVRVYNDPSVQAKAFYRENCITSFSDETFESRPQFIMNHDLGRFSIQNRSSSGCGCSSGFSGMALNYRAGLLEVTRLMESTVIRLAHSLMASEPCSEPILQRLWLRDRDIPKILTKERIECPFGMSDGAWVAWKWACGQQVVRMTSLVGKDL